ncbi:hypothetical protein [Kribbella monticola]|uniref:hypothetical protein n=1 Tax=Kribbella monticola TaxID=2185285 RepID=UPI000DD38EA3|nr:hypothetical protein [Kribbella monticola]
MIIAIDAASRNTTEAEHLFHELLGPAPGPVIASTHTISTPNHPHLAISLTIPATGSAGLGVVDRVRGWLGERAVGAAITWSGASEPELSGPSQLVRGAYAAAVESALGTAGRLVRFPGSEHVRGAMTALQLRDLCGIDHIEALGGLPVDDDTVIDTLDFIRPIRRDGRVVLLVQPAAGGALIPFEVEHQQKCCADH